MVVKIFAGVPLAYSKDGIPIEGFDVCLVRAAGLCASSFLPVSPDCVFDASLVPETCLGLPGFANLMCGFDSAS
jgi:hypothetical protein